MGLLVLSGSLHLGSFLKNPSARHRLYLYLFAASGFQKICHEFKGIIPLYRHVPGSLVKSQKVPVSQLSLLQKTQKMPKKKLNTYFIFLKF